MAYHKRTTCIRLVLTPQAGIPQANPQVCHSVMTSSFTITRPSEGWTKTHTHTQQYHRYTKGIPQAYHRCVYHSHATCTKLKLTRLPARDDDLRGLGVVGAVEGVVHDADAPRDHPRWLHHAAREVAGVSDQHRRLGHLFLFSFVSFSFRFAFSFHFILCR